MSHRFIEIDRSQPITRPGNREGWLDRNDRAHCIVEVVEALDTRAIEAAYHGGNRSGLPRGRQRPASAEDAVGVVILLLR